MLSFTVVGAAQPVTTTAVHALGVSVTVTVPWVAQALGVKAAVVSTTTVDAFSTLFWGK